MGVGKRYDERNAEWSVGVSGQNRYTPFLVLGSCLTCSVVIADNLSPVPNRSSGLGLLGGVARVEIDEDGERSAQACFADDCADIAGSRFTSRQLLPDLRHRFRRSVTERRELRYGYYEHPEREVHSLALRISLC